MCRWKTESVRSQPASCRRWASCWLSAISPNSWCSMNPWPASTLRPGGSSCGTLLELLQDRSHTILFSTHITSDLERVAQRVAILGDGKIRFHGELDELKDRVKRLRITARHELPASFAVPGALRCEVDGLHATVSVTDFDERLVAEMRRTWDADVAVSDLNLEEIFVEMHDGSTSCSK